MTFPSHLYRALRVLYEDRHLWIVDKPSGVRLPFDHRVPASRVASRAQPPDQEDDELIPINRLAPTESGIVIFARTRQAGGMLQQSQRDERIRLVYSAVVTGRPRPKKSTGGSRTGTSRRHALLERVQVRVLSRGERHSRVEVRLEGGASIDIRGFLRSRYTPVVGDMRGDADPHHRYAGRCFLHLGRVEFAHPSTNSKVTVTAPEPAAFSALVEGRDLLEDCLSVALQARLELLSRRDTNAYRLVNGAPDGIPGLVTERYGDAVICFTYPNQFKGEARQVKRAAGFYLRRFGLSCAFHKEVTKRGARALLSTKESEEPIVGKACPEEILALENGIKFRVRPRAGLNAGLYLDQRDNRARVRAMAAGKRVLNTFAYTCGFSVAAAAGGAESTVSVDLSAKNLEWGRSNFEANGLGLENHQFVKAEIFDFLKRAKRSGKQFDLIILDPPTFARSKKPRRIFSIEADLERLIAEALTVLSPTGLLLVNTNARTRSVRFLRTCVSRAAAGRRWSVLETPPLPVDFETDPDHSKSLWIQFKSGAASPAEDSLDGVETNQRPGLAGELNPAGTR